MDLGLLLTGLTILSILSGAFIFIVRWLRKQYSALARVEVALNQKVCERGRQLQMSKIEERLDKLEQSDNATDLTIAIIQKDLENLTSHHETTQMMIQRLEDHQQTTFTQLIETIKSVTQSSKY